jgi:hypothetical protein
LFFFNKNYKHFVEWEVQRNHFDFDSLWLKRHNSENINSVFIIFFVIMLCNLIGLEIVYYDLFDKIFLKP